jgi:hypothetical protein
VHAFEGLDAVDANAARRALISDAVSFYMLEGLPQCVALSTNPDTSPFTDLGFKVTIPSELLTIHRNVFRQFSDASEVFFSRRNELNPRTDAPPSPQHSAASPREAA